MAENGTPKPGPRFTRAERLAQEEQAFELKRRGWSYRRIGRALELSHSRVFALVSRHIEDLPATDAEIRRWRALLLSRLEMVVEAAAPRLSGRTPDLQVAARRMIEAVLAAARIMGLNKIEIEINVRTKVAAIAEQAGIGPEEAVELVEQLIAENQRGGRRRRA